MPASPPTGEPLVGRFARLDPRQPGDEIGLFPIMSDPRVYRDGFIMHAPPADVEATRKLIATAYPNSPDQIAYTARLVGDSELGAAGTVVGTSSLLDIDLVNESIHIGSTMWGSRWWGTKVNPEAKLLMLGHVFGLGFGRVKIQTDLLNEHSQAAIAKLGAQREGVFRRDRRREDGTFRDTVVFSVLRDEWPQVRAGLEARLG